MNACGEIGPTAKISEKKFQLSQFEISNFYQLYQFIIEKIITLSKLVRKKYIFLFIAKEFELWRSNFFEILTKKKKAAYSNQIGRINIIIVCQRIW